MTTTVTKMGERFLWVDVVEPTHQELQELAKKFGLHSTSVEDCLDPRHLPKFERIGALNFLVLRAYDESCPADADTVQELTRKIAVFSTDEYLITIHRKDQPFFRAFREKWCTREIQGSADPSRTILRELIGEVFATYRGPIDGALDDLDAFEMGIFGEMGLRGVQGGRPFRIKQAYYLKRKAHVYRRMLRLSLDALIHVTTRASLEEAPLFQDIKENAERLFFYADELVESVNSLLNLHVSLVSQKTTEASNKINEVMRVLTVFSVFFLPLNLIAGIYGMNFEFMPELKWKVGYPLSIALMLIVALGIMYWFRRRGWLRELS